MSPTPDLQDRFEAIGSSSKLEAGSLIVTLLVVLAIIFAAYYVTKLIAGKAVGMMRSKKMRVVDTLALSRDKQIVIVQVGEQAHLLGVSASGINELALLPGDILDEPSPAPAQGEPFISRFVSAMKENAAARAENAAARVPGRSRRPTGAYERAKSEYERTLRENSDAPQPTPSQKGDNLDDMADMARRRGMRLKRHGDDE